MMDRPCEADLLEAFCILGPDVAARERIVLIYGVVSDIVTDVLSEMP